MNMKLIMFSAVFLLLISIVTYTAPRAKVEIIENEPTKQEAVLPYAEYSLDENVLWDEVNKWRVSENLNSYIKNENLCAIARERALETKEIWTHDGFQAKRMEYHKLTKMSRLSENLSTGMTETSVLDGWLSSPSHREALEFNYTHSCIAVDGTYAVQIFGRF